MPRFIHILGMLGLLLFATSCSQGSANSVPDPGSLEFLIEGSTASVEAITIYFWPEIIRIDGFPYDGDDGGGEDAGQDGDLDHVDGCQDCGETFYLRCTDDSPGNLFAFWLEEFSEYLLVNPLEHNLPETHSILVEKLPHGRCSILVVGKDSQGKRVSTGCATTSVERNTVKEVIVRLDGE